MSGLRLEPWLRSRPQPERDHGGTGTKHMWVGDLAYLLPALLLSFTVGYPIYEVAWYFVVVLGGMLLATVLSWISARKGASLKMVAVWASAFYLVLGLPLAAPEVFWAPLTVASRFVGLVIAPLAAARQILTLELPLGTYQDVLAPVFFLSLFVTLAVFTLAWRARKLWFMAAPIALVPMVMGIAFGPAQRRGSLPGPVWLTSFEPQSALGISLTLLLFGWVTWRSKAPRIVAALPVEAQRGFEAQRGLPWRGTAAKRTVAAMLSVSMLVLAVGAAAITTPALLQTRAPHVLRTDTTTPVLTETEVSPLSEYRRYFDPENVDASMFTVSDYQNLSRIRIATLNYYDGHTFRFSGPEDSALFQRIPHFLEPSGLRRQAALEPNQTVVEIGKYKGVWVPLPGELGSVLFEGEHRAALQDSFYYSPRASTGVSTLTPGLEAGVRYRVTSYGDVESARAVQEFVPAEDGSATSVAPPESLVQWVSSQEQPATGAGLVELIDRLRARGYLSHSLLQDEAAALWIASLGPSYQFHPSRAGHSLDRIGALFDRLNERQVAVGAGAGAGAGVGARAGDGPGAAAALIGPAGDDEQFAVAAALIADHLGFNVRVVLGARLGETHDDLPTCQNGDCLGADMAAWIEVQDGKDGPWAALDVTPQHVLPPAAKIQQTSEPKNPTTVLPEKIRVVPPPPAQPSSGSTLEEGKEKSSWEVREVPSWLKTVMKVGLTVCALGMAPLVIVTAKHTRTRRRQRGLSETLRACAAWEDLLDTARDFHHPVFRSSTRVETALQLMVEGDSGSVLDLAHIADRASFANPSDKGVDSEEAWRLSGIAKMELAQAGSFWQKCRARFSVRSLVPKRKP